MPTVPESNLPTPKSWGEFEAITLDAANIRWKPEKFSGYGRSGQVQHGVDIWSQNLCIGIQCKNTVNGVSKSVVEEEICKAESFAHPLDILYIATTASRDVNIQNIVWKISEERKNKGKFLVDILFWEDITSEVGKDVEVVVKHYPYLPKIATQALFRVDEIAYLKTLLHENEKHDLRFSNKVYVPLGGRQYCNKYKQSKSKIPVACMLPSWRHRKHHEHDEYCEPTDPTGDFIEHDDVVTAFKKYKRLMILGEPGAGKTFSLWRVASDYAQKALEQRGQLLPVIIPLNFWTEANQSLHDFVLEQMSGLAKQFNHMHQTKRLLPLFDALNEIPHNQREEKLPQVRRWLERYATESVLLTCRLRDYREPLKQEIDTLTIKPLEPPRIYEFLCNYFSNDEGDHKTAEELFWQLAGEGIRSTWEEWEKKGRENYWEAFWTLPKIPTNYLRIGPEAPEEPEEWRQVGGWNDNWKWDIGRQIYLNDPRCLLKLASNPFLLSMIVQVYGDKKQLPQSRIELLSDFVDELIFREMQDKLKNHYSKPDEEQLRAELKSLAWQLQSRAGSSEEVRTTLSRIEAEQAMPLLRLEFAAAASLLEITPNAVRFSHQLLQEFFTAQSFKERREAGLKASDIWQPDRWWETNGWEEAAKLAAEYEADPKPFLRWLAEGNPKLAMETASDYRQQLKDSKLFKDLYEGWQQAITDVIGFPNPHERHAISTGLGLLGWDSRYGIGLDSNRLPEIDWIEIPACEFIYREGERQQTLHLPTYRISRYPVTNIQFWAFVNAGGYETDEWWVGLRKPTSLSFHYWLEQNHPVNRVSWYESIAFCRWLSAHKGLVIRLPNEKEWEKAARGTDGRKYPWGNTCEIGYANIDEIISDLSILSKISNTEKLWTGKYALRETSAVGIYPHAQSPYGLMDVVGNVNEWCLNKCSSYRLNLPEGDNWVYRFLNAKAEWFDGDEIIDNSGIRRIARGNSWHGILHDRICSDASGDMNPDEQQHPEVGFRLVCEC